MNWIAWGLLLVVVALGAPRYFAASGFRWPLRQPLTSALLIAALALAGILAALGNHTPGHAGGDHDPEASPLRGGMWIGLLERAAIAATLWASWPEGLAVVLAVKGLGRFSELKQHAAAEQFILGTFVSVLWACAAVGVGRLVGA